jgi:hypothetical protein
MIAGKYDKVTCYPVGQKDGGRDITQKTDSGGVVYQVKWSKDSVKNSLGVSLVTRNEFGCFVISRRLCGDA